MKVVAPPLTELDFRRQLIDLAEIFGWEHVGFRPAKTEQGWRTPVTGTLGKGWPDLVLVRARDRRLIFAELKSNVGKVSPDQVRVLEILRSVEWPRCMCNGPLGGLMFGVQRTDDGKLHDSGCALVGGAFSDMATRIEVHVWRPRDFDQVREVLA